MGKMGRPKVSNPKAVKYSICIDNVTEFALKEYCTVHNITKGEAIRQAIKLLLAQK